MKNLLTACAFKHDPYPGFPPCPIYGLIITDKQWFVLLSELVFTTPTAREADLK